MSLSELARRENELYAVVLSLGASQKGNEQILEELGIFKSFYNVHQEYASLGRTDLEALKRGLFISWYSNVEPAYATGIRELDPESELVLLKTLNERIRVKKIDYELEWMLDHYTSYGTTFTNLSQLEHLQKRLSNSTLHQPNALDIESMSERGLMGIFWSFASTFN